MVEKNNPAARLLRLLKRAKELKSEGKNYTVATGWCQVFHLGTGEYAELYHRIGGMLTLPLIIKTRLERIPDVNVRSYLYWVSMLHASLQQFGMSAKWDQMIAAIHEEALGSLDTCGDLLEKQRKEPLLADEKLKELRRDAQELIDQVVDADIARDLKEFVLKHLDIILRSLDEYDIHGPDPLVHELESVFGSIITDKETAKRVNKEGVGKRFWDFMGKLLITLSVLKTAAELPAEIVGFLPSPDNVEHHAQDLSHASETSS